MKNPEKFGWRPKQLLPQLASIYLHLERADSKGAFAAAIAVSDRYRQDMFPETCQVASWLLLFTILYNVVLSHLVFDILRGKLGFFF